MRATLSLIRREFSAYFLSFVGYLALAAFLGMTGFLYSQAFNQLTETAQDGVEYPMTVMLGNSIFWIVFSFIPPLLTMRLFAEERGTGTLEMLMTAPIKDWQVVFAKFTACFLFYIVMWVPTLIYLPVLLGMKGWEARFDTSAVIASYIGVMLAGAMFLSIGLFVSSLVRSQMVAMLISLVLSLLLITPGLWNPETDLSSFGYRLEYFFSVPLHFSRDFARGVLDSRHITLYVTLTLLFLFLTVRSLESRRWR